jgi:NAD(P)-dependent dehydrogenase (short-subunit alcohol dehydrogenase family)
MKQDFEKLFDLSGKVAMITGAASGIGNGTAKFLAEAGAIVVLLDINEEKGNIAKEEIVKLGNKAEFLKCDVTKIVDCQNVANITKEKFGKINILVNCAGIIYRKNTVDLPEKDWDLAINVTLKSIYLMSKYIIPIMAEGGGGSIINIGSGWGLKGGENAVSYCAAKGGVWNLTRAMAIDHGAQNIRVNCVCPGDIDTPLLRSECAQLGLDEKKFLAKCADRPLNRIGTPIDVAKAVFFYASDMSMWVTGSNLVVDGGGLA